MWWIFVLVIIVAVCLVAWYSPVIVKVRFSRVAGDDDGEIFIQYLFGLVRIRRSLTMMNAKMTQKGPQVHLHHESTLNPHKKKEKIITASDVWEIVKDLSKWIDFLGATKPIVRRLWRKVYVKHLVMRLSVGTGDAVSTGVAVGALFGMANFIIGTSSQHASFLSEPQIEIQPNFNHLAFQIDFTSIIRVRAGYAISAAIRLFFVWKRRISDGAPDTRSDADSHGEHSGNGGREHNYRRSG